MTIEAIERGPSKPTRDLAGCALLDEQGRILLLSRLMAAGGAELEMPGGKVKPGEDPEAAAVRETREEVGVDVEIVKYLGQGDFSSANCHFEYSWFQGIIVAGVPHICEPDKHRDLEYFDLFDSTLDRRLISSSTYDFTIAVRTGAVALDSV